MAQEKLTHQTLQAIKLPDISQMTDEEIDVYAGEVWGKLMEKMGK